MRRALRITAVPADDAHPDLVAAAIEADLARLPGGDTPVRWIDACAGAGPAELLVRIDVVLPTGHTARSIEAALRDEMSRRRLRATILVEPLESDPLPVTPPREAVRDADARPATVTAPRAVPHDDVRRLIHLVPPGHVTTVRAIAEWMTLDVARVALAIEDIVAEPRLPWHRVTDDGGRLDTLRDGGRLRLQSARLETERVPVRHARVIGFDRYFVDAARLCGGIGPPRKTDR